MKDDARAQRAVRRIVGPVPPGRDGESYDRMRRRVLWLLPTGLFVLGSRVGTKRNLMTISWVMQVCLEPKLLAAAVEQQAVTRSLVEEGGRFSLSVLSRSDRDVVRKFTKPVEQMEFDEATGSGEMNGLEVFEASTGAPILAKALAFLDCELRHTFALGSHVLFVGEVVDVGTGEGDHDAGLSVPTKEPERAGRSEDSPEGFGEILRMEDTRMNYGG